MRQAFQSKGAVQVFVELAYASAEGPPHAKELLCKPASPPHLAAELSGETHTWLLHNKLTASDCIEELRGLFGARAR